MHYDIETPARVMTNTERWAARIVAASRTGAMVSYAEEALAVLNGEAIPADLLTSLCREAAALNHRMCDDEIAVYEANEMLSSVLEEFGLTEQSAFPMKTQSFSIGGSSLTSKPRSISDDDICNGCPHCLGHSDDLMVCSRGWPGLVDDDDYLTSCRDFLKN